MEWAWAKSWPKQKAHVHLLGPLIYGLGLAQELAQPQGPSTLRPISLVEWAWAKSWPKQKAHVHQLGLLIYELGLAQLLAQGLVQQPSPNSFINLG